MLSNALSYYKYTQVSNNKGELHGKHKVYTTKINRKHSPDTGIEPETSDICWESVLPLQHQDIYVYSCIILL